MSLKDVARILALIVVLGVAEGAAFGREGGDLVAPRSLNGREARVERHRQEQERAPEKGAASTDAEDEAEEREAVESDLDPAAASPGSPRGEAK